MRILKKISLVIMVVAYLAAGINHFINPGGYIKIIPAYLPFPQVLNLLAGICEVTFALLLISVKTRRYGAWGIILMLIAFLPTHIDMIVHAPMLVGSILVTPAIAWGRIPVQLLLILWAWWYTKVKQYGRFYA
jgi:uncharacterized membrane protein